MFEAWLLLIVCAILSYWYDKGVIIDEKAICRESVSSKLSFFILLVILVFYAGLRTRMNDTLNYVYAYLSDIRTPTGLNSIFNVDWSLSKYPIFNIYFRFLKSVFGPNSQIMLFITSLIIVISSLLFLKKYSHDFSFSIFVYISFTVYAFSMAALKQCLSIAIGIWAIPLFLDKKYFQAAVLLIIAVMIHPFIALYGLLFLLTSDIWKKKTIMIIVASILVAAFYNTFVEGVLNVTDAIGADYDINTFNENGVGISRVLAYLIVPIFSFIAKDKINDSEDRMSNICINASILSGCIMALASLGGANFVGRTGNYFDIMTSLAAPKVFSNIEKNAKTYKMLYTVCMLFYYFTYFNKYRIGYCNGNWFECIYKHTSIWSLFSGG